MSTKKTKTEATKTENKAEATVSVPVCKLSKAQKATAASAIMRLRLIVPRVTAIAKPTKDKNGVITYNGKVYPSATQAFLVYNADKREQSGGIDCKSLDKALFKHSTWNMHARSTGEVTTLNTCRSVDTSVVCWLVFCGTGIDGKWTGTVQQVATASAMPVELVKAFAEVVNWKA